MAQLLKSEKKKLKKKEKKTTRSKPEAPAPSKDMPKDTDEIADLIDKLPASTSRIHHTLLCTFAS